jgi:chemotaxis family two-component system sensor histidine kinase/response regulator PixL
MNLPNQAYQLFIDDAPELLRQIEQGLLNLQEDKSIPKIHDIMRAVHSLKTSAASAGLQSIHNIANHLQDYLKALYNQNLVIDTELESLFLEAYDCLAIPVKQQLETGDFNRQKVQTQLNQITPKLASKLDHALEEVKNYLPADEELGIDIIQSLFEVDVVYEIRRLKGLIVSPHTFNVANELAESLGILKGISGVADLAGFSVLITVSEQALDNHPDKALAIAGLLLNDLQKSRELVLNGDRTEGGSPCATLLDLAENHDAHLDNKVVNRIIREQKTTMTVEDPVYQFFMAEIPDLLHILETGLLSLQADKSINNINELMRAAHSLKGGAASVGLDGIKNMAHKLEDYIKALFDETVIVDDELETDFLHAVDCLKNALTEQIDNGNYSIQWHHQAESIWQKLEEKLGAIDNQDYLPSSADLGYDLVTSIFEVDIANIITELQTSLEQLSPSELLPTVTQQLEVISGLAEISASIDLTKVVTLGTQSLFHHPEETVTITSLLIEHLIKVRKTILNKDDTLAPEVSSQLLALAEMSLEDWKSAELLSESVDETHEHLDEDSQFNLPEMSELNDLFDQEIFDSGDNSEIFETPTSEFVSFPESSLFAQNPISKDLSPEEIAPGNIFALMSDDELATEINDDDVFASMTDEDLADVFNLEDVAQDSSSSAEQEEIDAQQQELQAQSYQFFLEEAVDLIAVIDENLENVLAHRHLNEINEVARCAHSLKGGSRSAGLEDIGMIALRVEKSLKALFNENIPLTESLKSYLREIYQLLRQAVVARIENQEFEEKTAVDTVNEMWSEFEAEYAQEIAQAEEFLPSSSDLGIDIATSIFEIDVLEGINNLEEVLNQGSETELEEVITTQIEVFSGFGEMLSLPGFVSICQTATEAMSHNPQQLPMITKAFIDSLRIARDLVLQGDREQGGEPNSELLNLAGKTPSTEELAFANAPTQIESSVDIQDKAYGFFIEEVPELLQIIETGLLTLREEERETAKIHEIMRAAHSLKGGAASVGLEGIKTIAHQLEDVFKVLYDPSIEVDTELESWLLESFDCLSQGLQEQIETGSYNAETILAKAHDVWAKINRKLGDALARANDYIPSSTDLGVDIVQSIFEVDVAEELARLQTVITQPITDPLPGELRATLEVFSGFGEMLNLSGFLEIAQLGLKAMDLNPDYLVDLIQIIINDVEAARKLVLKGDRSTGGQPSLELRRLAENQLNSSADIEPSLDDVFGEQISQAEELFQLNPEDLNTQTDDALLEDVFASELSSEEMNLLSQASELSLQEEQNETIASLEEIFETTDLEDIINSEEENFALDTRQLEDVFGSELEQQETFDLLSINDEELSLSPIEEVFTENNLLANDALTEAKIKTELLNQELQEINTYLEPSSVTDNSSAAQTPSPEDSPQSLAEALQSIGDIYQTLPGLKDNVDLKITAQSTKKSPKSTPSSEQATSKTVASTTKANLTIRVDLDRLERMNNLIGELSINRNGLSLQNEKLQNSVQGLLQRFGNFQQMANNLRDLADKMLVSPEKFAPTQNGHQKIETSFPDDELFNLNSAFDALEMDRYDNLYSVVQGLIEEMIQLEEAVDDIALFASQSGETVDNQRQMLNRLRDELMWARMLPLGEILNRFPRILRDLSVKYNKKVNLKIDGNNVLVDKAALEKLYDPLVHLVRNAFDHGIETPEVRRQRGKSTMGTIHVKAYHQGNQTIIEIRDDGGGLNLNKIGQKAIERNLLTPEQLAVISKENLLDLIFEPGFSTAAQVTEISGRGVGLDIVRSQLRALKGNISVTSESGVGTTFTLSLPLTLTIDKLLVLSTGSHFYALPSDNIAEIIVPEEEQIKTSGNQRFLFYENQMIPIYALNNILQYGCYVSEGSSINPMLEILPTPEEWGNPLLLINLGKELFAVEVEHLVSEQELVIKPFGTSLTAPSYTYGCTILGDGTLIPVINTSTLLANFLQVKTTGKLKTANSSVNLSLASGVSSSQPNSILQSVTTILVVDDSAAMRRTLALSLEKAGYRVAQAKDGKDALEQLQQLNNISLVICDIEMPNMNGFEFLGQRRRYPELNQIPVAMLTSRSNDKHRKLATHLGANAYFTKPYIEQKFLQSIHNLVQQKSLVSLAR